MANQNPKIVVAGDICVNSLQWSSGSGGDHLFNYNAYPRIHKRFVGGGALLLAKLISMASGVKVIAPDTENVTSCLPDDVLVSIGELGEFPLIDKQNQKEKVYRIDKFIGYTIEEKGQQARWFPLINDREDADIVVLDDDNNGFNADETRWPLAVKSTKETPIILYKTNKIDFSNNLWRHIEKHHLKNTIVIISADDLRAKGVNISKGLSWERTGLDFVWQMKNNSKLKHLSKCRHLIIPFGLEGAIYYHNDLKPVSKLYFLTNEFEGGFIKENTGKMYGLTSCFVAGLTKVISEGMKQEELSELMDEGIRQGMIAAQKYFMNGFGSDLEKWSFPNQSLFDTNKSTFYLEEHIQDVKIKNTNNAKCKGCWYIIKDKSSTNLEQIAYEIVKKGEESALKYIPIAQFRNLKTVDRTEIEAYRSIKNLIAEYISTTNTVRPLSIAVFGTPGSGKSFGVTEVAASIAPDLIEKLDFNLSQFQSIDDLIAAFHKTRDISLNGKIPLIFWDEFDSSFGEKLGWLKYFLAPMQDGLFREGDSMHPLGKAIFVFAGGTSSTYEAFCGEKIDDEEKYEIFLENFQNAKGPDFISRLRGYVNILGPNQTDKTWDQLFILRRAMLLRSLLVRKVPYLINEKGEAQVDVRVIRALLKVPKYKHETRSMEAILEMSMLAGAKKWEQSHLPSKSQLKLHVDEEQFYHYMMMEEFFSEKVNSLSNNLLNKFSVICSKDKEEMDYDSKNHLDIYVKEWVNEQVKNIPEILSKVHYELFSTGEVAETVNFTQDELITLAQYQHKLWVKSRKKEGWQYGEADNLKEKISPFITSWGNLSEERKEIIFNYIRLWPEALADSKFKIGKLNFLCYCESQAYTQN